MQDEKVSPAQRHQAGLEAAESGRNLRRHQQRAQAVPDRAAKQVTEAQEHPAAQEESFSKASPVEKEAAKTHVESIRFLNTEAHAGLTLARIATESRNPKRARNLRLAREAYDSVLKYPGRAAHISEELEGIRQKMVTLRELLKSLGEQL